MKVIYLHIFLLISVLNVFSSEAFPYDQSGFVQTYWYERGMEHGNPDYNTRFRVNSPEAVLHPSFKDRPEARGNGMMLIQMEEDLSSLREAELYLELWGGHPGTANKRVTINGRSIYALPDNGTEEENCTHAYPTVPLKITDLVNGYNALQFACDQGKSFWGHYIVDNACLRAWIQDDHASVEVAGLEGFEAAVEAQPGDNETIRLALVFDKKYEKKIAAVDFWGYYKGYDENGDGREIDWHGCTKDRLPYGHLGTVTEPPFALAWDVSMLPSQEGVRVKAVIHFKDDERLTFCTAPVDGLKTPDRTGDDVWLVKAQDIPQPFWSRAGRTMRCRIPLAVDPSQIAQTELHVAVWDGGQGTVDNYFTLNGCSLAVAGKGKHDVLYKRLPIDPALLRKGDNLIELLSDTEHHGIEVLLPGPALMIRTRTAQLK